MIPPSSLSHFLRLARFLPWYPGLFVLFLLVSILAALTEGLGIGVLIPILTNIGAAHVDLTAIPFGEALNAPFSHLGSSERLRAVGGLIILIGLARGLFGFFARYLAYLFQVRITQDVREQAYRRAYAFDLLSFEKLNSATLINVTGFYAHQLGVSVGLLAIMVGYGILFFFYAGLLLFISWKVTLLAVFLLGLADQGVRKGLSRKLVAIGEAVNLQQVRLNQHILDTIGGMRLIRFFAQEEQRMAKYGKLQEAFFAISLKSKRLEAAVNTLFTGIVTAIVGLLLMVSTLLPPGHAMAQVGNLILFLFLLNRLQSPIGMIAQARAEIFAATHGVESVLAFLEQPEMTQEDGGEAFPGPWRQMAFQGVSFRYGQEGEAALSGLNFVIREGAFIGVAGPSGAGKSTLIALLTRLFDPTSGSILVDGVDLRRYGRRSYRTSLAVVPQETFLFNGTVAENIAFARPDASPAAIEQAAREARAHDFIMEMAERYDTVVGERGTRLSGGQRQRLAIARALLLKPQMLILDEITSQLDATSTNLIQETVEQLKGSCALVVIAHRLSLLREADTILVLERGQLVEAGDHATLLAQDGLYRRLHDAQNQEPAAEEAPP